MMFRAGDMLGTYENESLQQDACDNVSDTTVLEEDDDKGGSVEQEIVAEGIEDAEWNSGLCHTILSTYVLFPVNCMKHGGGVGILLACISK